VETFSTTGIGPSHQAKIWQMYMREVYYDLEIKSSSMSLRGELSKFAVGRLGISRFDSDAQRVFRTTERVRRAPDDSYVCVMPVRGTLFFNQDNREGFLEPGDYVLVTSAQFYELSCNDKFLNWTIKIPGDLLRTKFPEIDDHLACRFPSNAGIAGELIEYCNHAIRATVDSAPSVKSFIERSVLDLLVAMIMGESRSDRTEETATLRALRSRIFKVIGESYADADLTPSKIADDVGISLSYLHRVISSTGKSVSSHIMDHRLRMAREKLMIDGRNAPIKQIAIDVGFVNMSHFSRVFLRKYGMTPRQFRLKNRAETPVVGQRPG